MWEWAQNIPQNFHMHQQAPTSILFCELPLVVQQNQNMFTANLSSDVMVQPYT